MWSLILVSAPCRQAGGEWAFGVGWGVSRWVGWGVSRVLGSERIIGKGISIRGGAS